MSSHLRANIRSSTSTKHNFRYCSYLHNFIRASKSSFASSSDVPKCFDNFRKRSFIDSFWIHPKHSNFYMTDTFEASA